MRIETEHQIDTETTRLGESGYSHSASNAYHDDTSDLGGATFDAPVADDKTFEPEVDDSEPGPTHPDPTDDGAAEGEIYLVDIVGLQSDAARGILQSVEPLFEARTEGDALDLFGPDLLAFDLFV